MIMGVYKMIRIGVVEDEAIYQEQLRSYLGRFKEESGERFSVTFFENGEDFLENFQQNFDLLILDIQLGQTDGMEVAHRIRETDEVVVILFVTCMPQYAIQGYSVGAAGYMLKPISYFQFCEALRKIIRHIRQNSEGFLIANTREGMLHILYREITFIETQGRGVCIHTTNRKYPCSMKMRELEQLLPETCFFRCHNCYFVNLRHVESVGLSDAIVGQERVFISRLKKVAFMQALAGYGGGNIK